MVSRNALLGVGIVGGTALASGLITGIGSAKVYNKMANKSKGSGAADFAAGLGTAALMVGGVALMIGGTAVVPMQFKMLTGAAGFGAIIGAFAGHAAYRDNHGYKTETMRDNIFNLYNHDRDKVLDLDPNWRMPEYIREHENCGFEDDDGHRDCTKEYYSIREMADRADTDNNNQVSKAELLGLITSYDENGNGRIARGEMKKFEREVGEDRINPWSWRN